MSIYNNKSSGFTVVEVLLVVLTLAITGVVGYFVAKHIDTKKVATTTSTQSSPVPVNAIFKIPELDIQITVPNSLKDLTYAVSDPRKPSETTSYGLSTTTLFKADSACTPQIGPLGWLSKTSGRYPKVATSDNSSGELIKQYSAYYISYEPPQETCTLNSTVQSLLQTDIGIISNKDGSLSSNTTVSYLQ